jgi:DNA-binding MarR family transcriptional regulator
MTSIESSIKQSKFKNEHHKMVINLLYTASWLEVQHQHMIKPYGITMQQYNILRILRGQKGQPLSVNELISRMLDQNSNASRLVDKLYQKKLVDRTICPKDRRQVEVRITDAGLDLLKEIDEPMNALESLTCGISEKDAALVNDILDRIRSHQD